MKGGAKKKRHSYKSRWKISWNQNSLKIFTICIVQKVRFPLILFFAKLCEINSVSTNLTIKWAFIGCFREKFFEWEQNSHFSHCGLVLNYFYSVISQCGYHENFLRLVNISIFQNLLKKKPMYFKYNVFSLSVR